MYPETMWAVSGGAFWLPAGSHLLVSKIKPCMWLPEGTPDPATLPGGWENLDPSALLRSLETWLLEARRQ